MNTQSEQHILEQAAGLLAAVPYQTVTLEAVADELNISMDELLHHFPSMHSLGSAILTHEGATMRKAQQRAEEETPDPLVRLHLAFRLVGRNLAVDPIVRAGIRIAAEAAPWFPERNINPFRTWEAFVTRNLDEANDAGLLKAGTDIASASWLYVAAGMGTKDLLAFTGDWPSAEDKLATISKIVIESIRQQ